MGTGSDYEVIIFEIISSDLETVPSPTAQRFNWRKADWEKFSQHLKELSQQKYNTWNALHEYPSLDGLEQAAILLRDILLDSINESVPLLRPSPRSKAWWNEEITQQRALMNRWLKTWKLERTETAWKAYKEQRNSYFRMIRRAKEDMWKKFLTNAQGKEVFTALNYSKPRKVLQTPTLNANNRTTTTFHDKAAIFREALFPLLPDHLPQDHTGTSANRIP